MKKSVLFLCTLCAATTLSTVSVSANTMEDLKDKINLTLSQARTKDSSISENAGKQIEDFLNKNSDLSEKEIDAMIGAISKIEYIASESNAKTADELLKDPTAVEKLKTVATGLQKEVSGLKIEFGSSIEETSVTRKGATLALNNLVSTSSGSSSSGSSSSRSSSSKSSSSSTIKTTGLGLDLSSIGIGAYSSLAVLASSLLIARKKRLFK